jgi:hypothetical protein
MCTMQQDSEDVWRNTIAHLAMVGYIRTMSLVPMPAVHRVIGFQPLDLTHASPAKSTLALSKRVVVFLNLPDIALRHSMDCISLHLTAYLISHSSTPVLHRTHI